MRYIERVYLEKQPEWGDKIVITNDRVRSIGYKYGSEMIITEPQTYTGNCVFAYHKRSGRTHIIHDNEYRIYTDITYVKTGEQHIVKRFLGIPFYRKTIDIYEEE